VVDTAYEEKNLRRTSGNAGLVKSILVIGKHGQLSKALAKRASNFGIEIIGAYDIEDQDLTAPAAEIEAFAKSLPKADGLIIAAAYTAVDNAETNVEIARQINAAAPGIFARECVARNIPLVHISTDYVFSGDNDRPWLPDDEPAPINVYGETKLGGEIEVTASGARAAMHRTSWVYDGTGKNFMLTMLGLAQSRDSLNIVDDQIGRPTYAGHLADASLVSLKKLMDEPAFKGGIYHVSNTGSAISWADFAQAIFDIAAEHIPHKMSIGRIPSSDYPTPAARPAYSVMDTSSFEQTFGYDIPDWETGLKAAFDEWTSNKQS